MFRKMHSKNRVTVGRALRMEFAVYLDRMAAYMVKLLNTYPKLIYSAMLSCIAASVTIILFFSRSPQNPPPPPVEILRGKPAAGIPNGFGQLLATGKAIQQVLALQYQVDELPAKDSLNRNDSVLLQQAGTRLEHIHHQNQTKP
jgi:hypothetical protein